MRKRGMPGGDASRRLIDQAARSFDAELHTGDYGKTHSDAGQLAWMVSKLCTGAPRRVLDLGTGNGYVAMAVASHAPQSFVTGVDVAQQAIAKNKDAAASRQLSNVEFQPCDGITLPFPDERFDGVASRYAFHHFPRPDVTLPEIRRVLRPGSRFVLADAVREDRDDVDFINAFQKLKPDGHVEMLRSADLIEAIQQHGFRLEAQLRTALTFDRTVNRKYEDLIRITPDAVLNAYALSLENELIKLTFPICSAVFVKHESPH